VTYAGIILAAGKSSRMGTPKALLELRGETFVDRLIRCFAPYCSPIIVVLGHEPEIVRAGVHSGDKAVFVLNTNYQRGQFSSLQCGLRAIPPTSDGVVFTPVDHPNIEPSTVGKLIDARSFVAIPQYLGRHGHPVLCSAALIPEFLALPLESQAPVVMHRHQDQTRYIDVADPGILDDIDDPEAYRRLVAAE
jgi:molybdenum cofactor cytidylyltransferase